MNLSVYEIPYEERASEWMTMAVYRYRFQRRIEPTGLIIEPVLKRHLNLKLLFYCSCFCFKCSLKLYN